MRIAVVGAGVGGLVAAAGLQRDGHEVTVFEQREDAGAIGAGLTLFGNAFAALDAIGLGDPIRQISSTVGGRLRSGQRQPSGRWLVSMPPSATSSVRSLHRADLHTTLAEMLEPGTLRLGSKVTVESDGGPVLSVCGHDREFDLVVAADGLRSEARRQWGLDRSVRYAGYTAWRGVTASHGHLADEAGETWGRGARFGIVPLPKERVYWFATLATPPGAHFEEDHDALRELFGSWHQPIGDLIEATPAGGVLRHDIYDLAELPPTFVTGYGVLLGDAAHAMTPDLGQGAGQAIEDAVTLILLLRDTCAETAGFDPAATLERYSQLRRTHTRALWRQSRLAGKVAQANGAVSSHLRDVAMRAAPALVMTRAMNRLQRWQAP